MAVWVLLTGLLICCASGWLLLWPQALAELLPRVFATRWRYAAALLRLLLGALLLASAAAVAFPREVALLGWLMVLGGLVLVVLPTPVVESVSAWFARLSITASRCWLGAVMAIGLFLVYAALA